MMTRYNNFANPLMRVNLLISLFILDREYVKAEILLSRSDGNRTIIHAAVMNSFARTNKDDIDTMDIKAEIDFKWSAKGETFSVMCSLSR